MVGHFRATIPGERFIEFSWQLMRLLDQRIDYRLAILAIDLGQHHVTRMALYQCGDYDLESSAIKSRNSGMQEPQLVPA